MKKVYINPRIRIADTDLELMEIPYSNATAKRFNSTYSNVPLSGEMNTEELGQSYQESLGAKGSAFDDE